MNDLSERRRLDLPSPIAAPASLDKGLGWDGGPLRILLASYRSAPHVGGQGIYVYFLSKALADLGHHVQVASGPPYPRLDPRVALIKLPSLDLFAEPNALLAFRPRNLRSYTDLHEWLAHNTGGFAEPYTFGRRLAAYVRRHRFDIVHDNQSLRWGLIDVLTSGTPVIATLHHPITRDRDVAIAAARDAIARALLKRWYGFLTMQKAVAQRLPALIAVSHSTRRDASLDFELKPSRLAVVHNGVDEETFRPLLSVPRDDNLMVSVASAATPLKGFKYLLDAFARLEPAFPKLRLVVVGKPPGQDDDRLLRHLGSRVTFQNNLSTDELVRLYARAGLAVCPSLYEGFGFPAAEAMACGVPVVATTAGALPEVVGEAGVLVPPGNGEALAGAIAKLLSDPGLRGALATRGRPRVARRFNWHTAAKSYVALYRRTISDAHGPAR